MDLCLDDGRYHVSRGKGVEFLKIPGARVLEEENLDVSRSTFMMSEAS